MAQAVWLKACRGGLSPLRYAASSTRPIPSSVSRRRLSSTSRASARISFRGSVEDTDDPVSADGESSETNKAEQEHVSPRPDTQRVTRSKPEDNRAAQRRPRRNKDPGGFVAPGSYLGFEDEVQRQGNIQHRQGGQRQDEQPPFVQPQYGLPQYGVSPLGPLDYYLDEDKYDVSGIHRADAAENRQFVRALQARLSLDDGEYDNCGIGWRDSIERRRELRKLQSWNQQRPCMLVEREGMDKVDRQYQTLIEARHASWLLASLMDAIQRQDRSAVCEYFTRWTEQLARHVAQFNWGRSTVYNHPAALEAASIPELVFAEILRNVDPLFYPENDIAHGLCLDQDLVSHTAAFSAVDVSTGVHKHHLAVREGILTLVAIRPVLNRALPLQDQGVVMRCVGASLSPAGANIVAWHAMRKKGTVQERHAVVELDGIKSRFALEPMYYQYDRTRVAFRQHDRFSNQFPMIGREELLSQWDEHRIRLRDETLLPWNEVPGSPGVDFRRMWRRRKGKWAFYKDVFKPIQDGIPVTEEFIAAALIGLARSQTVHLIRGFILEHTYGIVIRDQTLFGGFDFAPDDPLRPTVRLLEAVVESLGSIAEIKLARALLIFLSDRYDIPIPPRVWSNLLGWADTVHRAYFREQRILFKSMDRILGFPITKRVDILDIWDTMTSPPYSVTPSFNDYLVLANYFAPSNPDAALAVIREDLIPAYVATTAAHDACLTEETHQASVLGAALPSAVTARHRASILKDKQRHDLAALVRKILSQPPWEDHAADPNLIPDLLAALGPLRLDEPGVPLTYHTAQGKVMLSRPPGDPGVTGPYHNFVPHAVDRWIPPVRRGNFGPERINYNLSPDQLPASVASDRPIPSPPPHPTDSLPPAGEAHSWDGHEFSPIDYNANASFFRSNPAPPETQPQPQPQHQHLRDRLGQIDEGEDEEEEWEDSGTWGGLDAAVAVDKEEAEFEGPDMDTDAFEFEFNFHARAVDGQPEMTPPPGFRWPETEGRWVRERRAVPLARMPEGPVRMEGGIEGEAWRGVWKGRLKVEMMR